ncbi:uncharacterized protein N7482_001707 [Penicillium canariense]|uniref:Uncharacterized protein n=1 Tax=Penicillium canariense TaxID=189055 RepID=A0A9W9IEP7_9EURO|nr:uncharacterized protein N7482_001707 [Penicillium canariense]KAJ5175830.1 hypothetical protein N7482_001707 [Penicillium canariense]
MPYTHFLLMRPRSAPASTREETALLIQRALRILNSAFTLEIDRATHLHPVALVLQDYRRGRQMTRRKEVAPRALRNPQLAIRLHSPGAADQKGPSSSLSQESNVAPLRATAEEAALGSN